MVAVSSTLLNSKSRRWGRIDSSPATQNLHQTNHFTSPLLSLAILTPTSYSQAVANFILSRALVQRRFPLRFLPLPRQLPHLRLRLDPPVPALPHPHPSLLPLRSPQVRHPGPRCRDHDLLVRGLDRAGSIQGQSGTVLGQHLPHHDGGDRFRGFRVVSWPPPFVSLLFESRAREIEWPGMWHTLLIPKPYLDSDAEIRVG